MAEEEIPEIHIDHRSYGQEERFIRPFDFDFDDIPKKVKFSIHRMRGFDGILKEIRRPPPKYTNIWVKLKYGDWICPVLFEEDGRPYIMAPAKHTTVNSVLRGRPIEVKVYIREERAEEILELLKVATDFCSKCSGPLDTKKGAQDWLDYSSGGGAIADIFHCRFCEHENIRFNKEFIAEHPEMELT